MGHGVFSSPLQLGRDGAIQAVSPVLARGGRGYLGAEGMNLCWATRGLVELGRGRPEEREREVDTIQVEVVMAG